MTDRHSRQGSRMLDRYWLGLDCRRFPRRPRRGAGQGHGRPQAAAAAGQSLRPQDSGARAFRPRHERGADGRRAHRLLFAWLPRRRRGAARERPALAGHAAVAQSQLGPSAARRLYRAPFGDGEPRQRLARPVDRRHVAAARRSDARRSRLASDRSRCRHLAHAHAAARAVPRGARGNVGHHDGARGSARRRPQLGRRGMSRSCAPPPRTRRSSASSSTPRSSAPYAASPPVSPGCTRCAPITGTTIISTCGSPVRKIPRTARRKRRLGAATVATPRSPTGFLQTS